MITDIFVEVIQMIFCNLIENNISIIIFKKPTRELSRKQQKLTFFLTFIVLILSFAAIILISYLLF